MEPFCAAMDWGTTNMRLWLLDGQGRVVGRRAGAQGMRACMPDRFESVMEGHLTALGAPPDLPVVICGMAGARGGWREAAYLDAPARLDALHEHAVRIEGAGRDVRILPGICQREKGREDVMRGEETQLAGACLAGAADGLFCLPGTHSKWVSLESGNLMSFTTFLTGELYALLGMHSILRDMLGEEEVDIAAPPFSDAVREMLQGGSLTAALFSVRAGGLLSGARGDEARARLSGLLIGAEIAAARLRHGVSRQVNLIAGGVHARTYAVALALANIESRMLDGETLALQGLFRAAAALWPQRERS